MIEVNERITQDTDPLEVRKAFYAGIIAHDLVAHQFSREQDGRLAGFLYGTDFTSRRPLSDHKIAAAKQALGEGPEKGLLRYDGPIVDAHVAASRLAVLASIQDEQTAMRAYGYDPANPADVETFRATTPSAEQTAPDYTSDPYEFGSLDAVQAHYNSGQPD